MRTETSVDPVDRYLSLAARLTERRFLEIKTSAIAWCSENMSRLNPSNAAALDVLRTISLNQNLIALVIAHCYADIPKGRIYSAIFDRSSMEIEETYSELILGIFWQRLPTEGLEHGHHQVVLFEFPKGVPSLLQRLPLCDGTQVSTVPNIGMCDIGNLKDKHELTINT